jgi:polysaccharide chain length determinant protein (PEP-CTERM system associated)
VLPGRKYKADDILRLLWRRKWLIVLPFVVCSAGTYVVAKRLPDQFKSETTILVVPQRVPESYVRSTVSGRIEDRVQSLQQQILSRSRLERIILDFNLYRPALQTQPMESVIEGMRSAIKVDIVRGGEAFTVVYTASDPRTVQAVTERLASLFIEENVRDRAQLAIGTSDFLQTQLDDARKRLIEQEKRLERYRIQYAGQLPSQAPANLQAIESLRLQLQALDDALARARDRQVTLERQLAELLVPDAPVRAPAPAATSASADDAGDIPGATPHEQLENARRRLANLEARLTPAHPDIARLKRTVAQLEQKAAAETATAPAGSAPESLRERRARELRTDLDTLTREIATRGTEQRRVRDEMALYQSRLDAAPVREAELTELMRDYETMQQIYRTLLGKREDSKVAANLEQRQVGEQFRVLDPARVPERPFSPDRARINLLGAVFGLLLGLGATALLEYFDNTLKSEEDVRTLLGLPVVATIPVLGAQEAAR